MAYQINADLSPEDFTYDQFAHAVRDIEKQFTKDVCRDISGNYIFVTTYPFCQKNYFVKTTVSDYREVCGNIRIDFLTRLQAYSNYCYLRIREPSKKEFRGKIKFTPKGTLSLSMYFVGSDKKGAWTINKLPILQNESYITKECDAFFANDEKNADYDEVMNKAWTFLELDERFRAYPKSECKIAEKGALEEISFAIQQALCLLNDVNDLYGAVYVWHDVAFVFPMTRSQMKEVFKERDKIGGRRRWLPTVSKGYTKKNGTQVDASLKMGSPTFTIDGRQFSILVGREDFGTILSTKKQIARMKQKLNGAEIKNGFYLVNH